MNAHAAVVTKPKTDPRGRTFAPTIVVATPGSSPSGQTLATQSSVDTQATTGGDPSAHGWLELRIWAEMFHDAQVHRIAQTNRAERGGVDGDMFAVQLTMLDASESSIGLAMRRCYRRVVPVDIVQWQKTERGVGEHLLARLLGHLGDPAVATPHAWLDTAPEGHQCDPLRCGKDRHLVAYEPRPRTVGQLWAYCGVGDPTRKRRAGMTAGDAAALGNPHCKTIVHLLAEACMKQPAGNRYRDIYVEGRERYATRDGWTPGRQHAAALRLVKKALLKDLWLARHAQRSAATSTSGLAASETQKGDAAGESERVAS